MHILPLLHVFLAAVSQQLLEREPVPNPIFGINVDSNHTLNHTIELHDGTGDDNIVWRGFSIPKTGEWHIIKLDIGKNHADEWTESSFNSSAFRWDLIRGVRFIVNQQYTQCGDVWVDMFHFGKGTLGSKTPHRGAGADKQPNSLRCARAGGG